MGCGSSAEIYPGSKNKYVVDSPPGSGKSNNEETAESNNDSGSLTIGSPVVIRKDPTDKVIEEDAVRGFEDPEDDDIEELEKAKINTPSPGKKSPGQSPSTTTNKIETAEGMLVWYCIASMM